MTASYSIAELASELTGDPEHVGYGNPIATGDCTALAALLNGVGTGPAYAVTLASLTKDQALAATTPIIFEITRADPPPAAGIVAYWASMLDHLRAADQIDLAVVSALLSQAVADGVLTQPQVAAATTRQGSRAEALWGTGTTVSIDDVSLALRGGN